MSHAGTVRLGTEGAYPPYNFINDTGEVDGFERELGDELCARAELTCEWVTNDWDSIIPNLVSGNYDAIIAGMSITDERDEVIDFTQTYTPPTRRPMSRCRPTADLTGGVIAAQTGTIQAGLRRRTAARPCSNSPPRTKPSRRCATARPTRCFADKDYLAPIVEESAASW